MGAALHWLREGVAGRIILDRQEALNALNLEMVRAFAEALDSFAQDPGVQAVTVEGRGERAFCAGGDVLAFYRKRNGDSSTLGADFFREEYTLNRRIKRYPKPIVAFMDGITMGGGVGISLHASHRIVTHRTRFAMPETGIGLFPDVGTGHFLSRLDGGLGIWIALTGNRLGAGDCLDIGIGTHALDPAVSVGEAVQAVTAMNDDVETALAPLLAEPLPGAVAEVREPVARCFAVPDAETIRQALADDPSDWARQTATELSRKSPTSIRITLRQLELATTASFEEELVTEYRMSQACLAGHDFMEGIRAVLVDRDRNPQWRPDRLEDVTEVLVASHFGVPPSGDLRFD